MITHTPLVAGNLPIKTLVAMAMINKLKCQWHLNIAICDEDEIFSVPVHCMYIATY